MKGLLLRSVSVPALLALVRWHCKHQPGALRENGRVIDVLCRNCGVRMGVNAFRGKFKNMPARAT